MTTVPTFKEVYLKVAHDRDLTNLDQLVRWISTVSSHIPSPDLQRICQDALMASLQRSLNDALRSHTDKLRRELADATNLPKDLAWPDLLDHLSHQTTSQKPTPSQTDDQKDAERWRKLVASGRFIPSFNNPPLTLAPSNYTYAKTELDAAVDLYQP